MRVNWFFHRNRCCCCSCRCRNVQPHSSSGIYTVYSLQRFADVPMQIYYGPGYTERNVMEGMEESLQTIANTAEMLHNSVQRTDSCSSYGSCNSWDYYNSCNSCNSCNSRCSC